jgi:4-hydroxybutyrate CoA-transferase
MPSDGSVCLGVEVGHVPQILDLAQTVVGLLNPQMPEVPGLGWIAIDRLGKRWVVDSPLLPFDGGQGEQKRAVEDQIAQHILAFLPKRPVIQVGIGHIPDAVCRGLEGTGAQPLGLLTESGRRLLEAQNAPRRADIGLAMGSRELFNWMHHNRRIRMVPASISHSIRYLQRIDRLVALNSAVEVDLSGQVAAESIGSRQISGPGGQLEFMVGARFNPTGLSIIALPSTTSRGKSSRIVQRLRGGAIVTTPRTAVDAVVTEHGVADLRGTTLEERRERLIGIAHPEFRDELEALAHV